jgi:hypothetical protein
MQAYLVYGPSFQTALGPHSRGRCRAPLPRPGTIFSPALMAAASDPCAKFHEFSSMLKAPKAPEPLKNNNNNNNNKYSCEQRLRAQAGGTATPVPLVT